MNLKNRKITVLIDEKNFTNFEEICHQNGQKKSTLILKLICDYIKKHNDKEDSYKGTPND
jgi:metal-responsive CopG/Arc/MetJ family transcriptional regulator